MKRFPLKTKRLMIRPLELRDFKRWLKSQELTGEKRDKYDVVALPLKRRTYKTFKASVLRQRGSEKADRRYVWNLFLRKTGELIGFMDVKTINRDTYQMANFGYFITNHYRENGYAKEATRALVPAAFKKLGFHRLEAVIDLDNRASIALIKSSGFYREGIKKHYWFQNGRWEDQVVYIATPELWKTRNTWNK